jgi:energy-coupling factor transport system permease protein
MKPIDPRTKLAIGVTVIGIVFLSENPSILLAESAVLLSAFPVLERGKRLIRSLRMTLPMAAIVAIAGIAAFDAATTAVLTLRLFNLLTASILVFGSLDPGEMGDALRLLRLPYPLVFMFTASLRYVPLMGERARRIMDAQRSRGIDLRFRVGNAGSYMALLIPLMVQSFLLADELAVAMESRGFARKERTFRKIYRFGIRDIFLTLAAFLGLLFFAWSGIGR